jgi:hypothetical protein
VLTNDDVIKMTAMGFEDDVIQAKISQAPTVRFLVEVDDLAKLKNAGVTQPVIAAMIKRGTATAAPTQAQDHAAELSNSVVVGAQGPQFSEIGLVRLVTADRGELELRSVAGNMSTTYAFVTFLMHCNYPGLKADVRTKDRRPSLLIRSGKSPSGRLYLASAEIDKDDNVRSIKMANMKMFGAKNLGAPDSDNQISYETVQEGPDTWRITPKKELRPGEYGLWMPTMEIYDFGIDGG